MCINEKKLYYVLLLAPVLIPCVALGIFYLLKIKSFSAAMIGGSLYYGGVQYILFVPLLIKFRNFFLSKPLFIVLVFSMFYFVVTVVILALGTTLPFLEAILYNWSMALFFTVFAFLFSVLYVLVALASRAVVIKKST